MYKICSRTKAYSRQLLQALVVCNYPPIITLSSTLGRFFAMLSWIKRLFLFRKQSSLQNSENEAPLTEVKRWFRDKGDETLRLSYPLNEDSTVFDLGGFQGDFANQINIRYRCYVYLFEPSVEFFEKCEKRFTQNSKVHCFNFGLSDENGRFTLSNEGDGSSILHKSDANGIETVTVKKFSDVFDSLHIKNVDLIKINIEGSEYQLLDHMISSGLIEKFENIQVQFHDFVDNAKELRNTLTEKLSKTHHRTWCYEFVWENWQKNSN